jgi:hypothetical protein
MRYVAAPALTLDNARREYFQVNDFGPDGGYSRAWVDFKLGPIPMPFPNTAGRRRAVRYHDLHHVLTGYATDMAGECEISAWEVGSGCADQWTAWQLNLSGLFAGVLAWPRRTWRAFLRGRRSRNLYRARFDDALLACGVGEMRRELGLDADAPAPARPADALWFALAMLAGLAIGSVMLVLMIPGAIVANVAALLFRRREDG